MKHTKLVCCIMLIAFALLPSMTEAQTKNSTNEAVKAAKMALKKAQVKAEQARQNSGQSTAFFVFGTKKELKEQNILDHDEVLQSNFNMDYFTKIDIRIDKEIKLYSSLAEILTNHPSGSYTLQRDAKKQYVLRITDPQRFWSTNKYLVILVGEQARQNSSLSEVDLSKEIQARQNSGQAETQKLADNKIYDVVEEMPQFPGGPSAMFEYLSKSIHYPKEAEEKVIQGRVIVNFVVEPDGSISNVKVSKSVDPLLNKEAVRVVESMPHWIPGKQNGNAVRVKYTAPVTFKLQ